MVRSTAATSRFERGFVNLRVIPFLMLTAPLVFFAVAGASGNAWGRLAVDAVDATVSDADDHDTARGEPGADHAEHELPPLLNFDIGAAVWNLFIFLLTLLVLGVFVWPQILAGLQAREDKIQADLRGAEKANAEALATLGQYQAQLAAAQAQVQEMIGEARKNAERVAAGIVEEAKQDADRQRQRALAEIESAKTVAISDLAGQTSDLAISLARQVVGRELNSSDHADLIRQSLDRLPSHN